MRCHSISVCRGGGGEELCQMFLEIEKDGVCLYSIIDIVCKIVYELDKLSRSLAEHKFLAAGRVH